MCADQACLVSGSLVAPADRCARLRSLAVGDRGPFLGPKARKYNQIKNVQDGR